MDTMITILLVLNVTTNVLPARDPLLLVILVPIQQEKEQPAYVKILILTVVPLLLVLLVNIPV
jgi:hypothetical protein